MVKYLKKKWLGLTNHFDRSILFEISVFKTSKFNCIWVFFKKLDLFSMRGPNTSKGFGFSPRRGEYQNPSTWEVVFHEDYHTLFYLITPSKVPGLNGMP